MPMATPAQFSQIRILADDFARSWNFYKDGLGLTPVRGHGSRPYGEFRAGRRATVAVFDRREMANAVGVSILPPSGRATGPVALVLEVPDVDAYARELRSRKISLLRGPTDRPLWGLRTVHGLDPEGNLIEICSRL